MKLRKKSEISMGVMVLIILGAFALVFAYPIFKQTVQTSDSAMMKEWNIKQNEEFKPGNSMSGLSNDEKIVLSSLTALVEAINSVVNPKDRNSYSSSKVNPKDLPFDYMVISFSSSIELEEPNLNDFRYWNFQNKINIDKTKDDISSGKEVLVYADYKYGSCKSNSVFGGVTGWWTTCDSLNPRQDCYCKDSDDYDYVQSGSLQNVNSELLEKAKQSSLAPIRALMPVYNIELRTYDSAGNLKCEAKTSKTDKITDSSQNDLLVWGAQGPGGLSNTCPGNPNYQPGDGCDRNGNGIQGSYALKFYGKDWEQVIRDTNTPDEAKKKIDSLKANPEKIKQYFPNGKIEAKTDNGEGCYDSPTWLECNGVLIYYCGKFGYKSLGGSESSYYYHIDGIDNQIHSNAGIKVLASYNKGFTESKSSYNREGSNSIFVGGKQFLVGAWNYAKENDLDVFIKAIVIPIVGGIDALAMKKQDDPSVYCYNGEKIKDGPAILKCDAASQTCGVCNFELPQNITKEGALSWFSGYGDPKYVVYYEAFPAGEEEAWQIDPMEISYTMIIASNLVMPFGGAIIKGIGKLGGLIIRPIAGAKKIIKGALIGPAKIANGAKNILKSGIKEGTINPVYYKNMFDKGKKILQASKTNKQLINNADEAYKIGAKETDDLLETLYANPEAKAMADSFYEDLTKEGIKITAKKGAALYAGSLISAWEENAQEKFKPIGVNEIGYRSPYDQILKTGLQLPALTEDANKYTILLRKDKYQGGKLTNIVLDQADSRFYLASPCKANLAVVKAKKQCWDISGKIKDKNGKSVETNSVYPTGKAKDKFGNIAFYSTSIDKSLSTSEPLTFNEGVKDCVDKTAGFASITTIWEGPAYTTDAIIVNPVPAGNEWKEGNFCYGGSRTLAEAAKAGVFIGTIGMNIITEAVATTAQVGVCATVAGCVVSPFIEGVQRVVDIGIDIVGVLLINNINENGKWPNH